MSAQILPANVPGSSRETLEAFMARKHDPKWKPPKLGAKPKPVLPRIVMADRGPNGIAARYEYRYWNDFRTITEPVSLAEFIALKSSPNYKPRPIPAAPGVQKPTPAQVKASIHAWDAMVNRWHREHPSYTENTHTEEVAS